MEKIILEYAFYKVHLLWIDKYVKIGYTEDTIYQIMFVDKIDEENRPTQLTDQVANQYKEYFEGKRKTFDFPFTLQGTEFQKAVWQALSAIPYGETRTYQQIGQMIGRPKAVRAIGNANHCNPLLIAVPCHRVIGADGKPRGYACGMEIKEYLLGIEKKGVKDQ